MCEVCGKTKQFGHNVSHSKRRTKRVFRPNILRKRMYVGSRNAPLNGEGEIKRVKICSKCLKRVKRFGQVKGAEGAILRSKIVRYVDWQMEAEKKRKAEPAEKKPVEKITSGEKQATEEKERVVIEEIVGKRG